MAIWILYSTATMLEITTSTSNMGNENNPTNNKSVAFCVFGTSLLFNNTAVGNINITFK